MLIAEKYRLIGLTAIAAAAALPALTAVADMPSAVSSRNPVALERDFGRAGGDAYWIQREPTAPPGPVVKAYDDARTETIKAYDELKTLATQPPAHEPARYGRAGGFVGLDAINGPAQAHSGG